MIKIGNTFLLLEKKPDLSKITQKQKGPMLHKYTVKFIPYSKNNLPKRIPQIVYKSQQLQGLSKQTRLRLKWLIYYYKHGKNASLTSRYFGISRKTFWRKNDNTVLLKKFSSGFTPPDAVKIYKKRHHIENEGFRELKQGYRINKFLSRKFSGVYFHIIFTLLIYNFFKTGMVEI